MREVSRRDFLKYLGVGAFGLVAKLFALNVSEAIGKDDSSKRIVH